MREILFYNSKQHSMRVYTECSADVCIYQVICVYVYEWNLFIMATENCSAIRINCCNGFSNVHELLPMYVWFLRIFHRKFYICALFSQTNQFF